MNFDLARTIEILPQTPYTLTRMLDDLSPEWTESLGDPENWSPHDVIGHLIHCEETDWIARSKIILAQGESKTFVPFDRLAQFDRPEENKLADLLTEFARLRNGNLEMLVRFELTPTKLALKGIHPTLGEVTLQQLLSTWAVHDLGHIRQIVTFMARKYQENVSPWREYLSILV